MTYLEQARWKTEKRKVILYEKQIMETMDDKWGSGFCNGCIMRGICKCTGIRNNRDRRSSRNRFLC